jgi:GTP cyclohydrolase I
MQQDRIRSAVRELLLAIGEDPDRAELKQTPDKVAEAYASFFKGIGQDPLAALGETFPAQSDEAVILKDIELVSICEHHLLPFTGRAHIAYLPSDRVAGLGRLANVVEILAARPQLQENLTSQIAQAIEGGLSAKGVLVVIEARHQCVASRGARQPEVNTVTVASRGKYEDVAYRQEVMALLSMRS